MARALVNVPSSGTIGEVKASMMTLAQFQAQFGTNWVLADGSSATGTKYATITGSTTLPDCRGVTLRGKNNGSTRNPDGDLALGTYQADMYTSHTHTAPYNGNGTSGLSNIGYAAGDTNPAYGTMIANNPSGGNETRMKNVTVNYFIKVN